MPGLKVEMAKGVFWTAIGKYTGILISIIISMVLARLISPEEFGIVAIAQVAISFVGVLADMGIGAGIIQNKTLNEDDYDSLFTFSIILALFIALIIGVASPFIASFYNNAKLVPISLLIAVSSFFGTMNMVPESLFNKNKRFDFIAKRSLFFGVLSGIISITYAFMGGGCYALVLAPIISNLGVLVIGLKAYPRKIDWALRLEPLRKIFSFSVYQFLFNLVNYFSRNLDKLIIGKALNMKELGYYQKSYNLMLMPLQNVTFVITPVLQPFLSEYQNDIDFIRTKYLEVIKLVATISFPMGLLLFFVSKELIVIMYGIQWIPSVPVFEILALSIPLQMILSTTGSIFQSTGNTKLLFLTGILTTLITVSGFIACVLIHGNLVLFAWSWNLTLFLNFILTFYILLKKILRGKFDVFFKKLLHPIIISFFIAVTCLILNLLLCTGPLWIRFSSKVILSMIISFVILSYFKDYNIRRLFSYFKR